MIDARLTLVGDRRHVPLVTGDVRPSINFDFAASAPALATVKAAVDEFLPWYSSVHRGDGIASQVATEAYERARDIVADFVSARPDDAVVFTRHTTDALNLLARCVPEGTTVVTFEAEHHANLLPWRGGEAVHLPVPASPEAAVESVDQALRGLSGGAVVSVTAASNVTGERWPVAEIAAVARRHGARVVVDAAQLAPHAPVDMAAWDVDYVALSGHKLYAPFGAGALVGRRDWLDAGAPYLRGGGAVRFVTADDVVWTTGPERHEAGSPNVVGVVALAAACLTLRAVGMETLAEHEAALLAHARRRLREVPGIELYSLWGEGPRIGVVPFNVAGMPHTLLGSALSAEYGIAVRGGCFCAHPLMLHLLEVPQEKADGIRAALAAGTDVYVPGAVRASFGATTTVADIDALADALGELATRGPAWAYRWDAQHSRHVPDPETRRWPSLDALVGARPSVTTAARSEHV
jgi:selenocysteine lyase/cysteine desulfurase